MRTYIVTYMAEKNDVADEFEIDIDCRNIEFVMPMFREKVRLYKRVTGIKEKPITTTKDGNNTAEGHEKAI